MIAELSEFLRPGDEEDNGLNHTEDNDDVDHDITIVRSSYCAASVHATQCRPTVFKTHLITNNNSALHVLQNPGRVGLIYIADI